MDSHIDLELGSGAITIDDRFAGSAFAIRPDLVLTAAHVVGSAPAESVAYKPCRTGNDLAVLEISRPAFIDVAMLRLARDTQAVRGIVEPPEGANWAVYSQPQPRDPILDGVITGTARGINRREYQPGARISE